MKKIMDEQPVQEGEESETVGATKALGYSDFWEMRGRQAIWFSENVSYRSGGLVALIAFRIGLTPNMVSLISGGITLCAAWLAVSLGSASWVAGAVLVIGLQLGYIFDCADGMLSRATGRGSRFGALLDKVIDLTSGMVLPWILAAGAGSWLVGGESYADGVLIGSIIVRTTLCMMLWMKELIVYRADRLLEDPRRKTLWWRLKKAVTIYFDEPVYRFLIAISWVFGYFWQFMFLYHAGLLVIVLAYIISTKSELDAMDREQKTP